MTLNSQQEYRASETKLRDAKRVMIVGGGLIGTELAMDFVGRVKPSPVDHAASILSALMPAEVSSRLQHRLTDMGVHLLLKSQLQHLSETEGGIRATLDCNRSRKSMWWLPRRGCARKRRWRTAQALKQAVA